MSAGFGLAEPAGTGIRPLVLCIGNGHPHAVGHGVIRILIGAVPAIGAAYCSSVLCFRMILPCAVVKRVVRIADRADIRCTGGAILSVAMLSAAVWRILRCFRVRAVRISRCAAGGTSTRATMLRGIVILPAPIGIAVTDTGSHELPAIAAVVIPITAAPCGVGGIVVADGRLVVCGIIVAAERAIAVAAVTVTSADDDSVCFSAGIAINRHNVVIVRFRRYPVISVSPLT